MAAEDTVAVAGMAAEATVVVVVVTAAARMIREAEVVAAVAEATRGRPAAAVAAAIRDPVAIRSPVLLVAPHDAHLAGATAAAHLLDHPRVGVTRAQHLAPSRQPVRLLLDSPDLLRLRTGHPRGRL